MAEDETAIVPTEIDVAEQTRAALEAAMPSARRRSVEAVLVAALGGLPWVGGFAAAGASLQQQKDSIERDALLEKWLADHERRLEDLKCTLADLFESFRRLGESIDERLESEEYLALVRRAFGAWDRAETHEKRQYVSNLLANAAGYRLTSDDVLRLFVDWLDEYHEIHFAVIRAVYKTPGITRAGIWGELHRGPRPRDDSADADLFRMLIDDLSRGRVVRQHRETTLDGRFLRKPSVRAPKGQAPPVMKSAFDDDQGYELTDLGKQFVHYTMNEIVQRVASG